jgi:hypothetical protein
MRRLVPTALLLGAACVQRAPPAPPATNLPAPPPAQHPAPIEGPERVGYVVRRGADTVVVERTSRSRDLLSGDLAVRGQANVEYQVTLDPTATVSRLVIGIVPPAAGPTAAVGQRSTAEFRGDTVVIETVRGDSARSIRLATREGAIPYINPSMALAEQILRRARVIGGTQVELPVFLTTGSIQTVTAAVTFVGNDSARVAFGGTELRLATDEAGRVLGGTVPAQGLTIERTAELPVEP